MNKTLLIALISVVIAGSVAAQSPKASDQSKKEKKKNHGTVLQSHSKRIGNIGPFQVHSLRIRGLDSPNVSAAVIYDPRSETYTVVGPATGAGLGSAILGAAGNVGSSAVFGMSLRPTRINESISNNSQSEGGDASSVSKSAGGAASSSVKNSNVNSNNNRVDRVSSPSPKKSKKSCKSKR